MHNMDKIMNEEFNQEYGFLHEGELGYEGEREGEYEWEAASRGYFRSEVQWLSKH